MEEKILGLFLFNNKMKFSEIEKQIKARSNKLDYHLKKLISKGVLKKEKEYYELNESSEYIIPYLSNKKAVLPVILVRIGDRENIFLHKREKRPYKGKLSLPGGRMILGEDIPKAVTRIMKEKHNLNARLIKINSVSLEHVIKNKKIIHSFLLILVSAEAEKKIPLIEIAKNKKNIIPSDFKLINNEDSDLKIEKIVSRIQ
ncbi:MAG: hypothetical protein M1416_01160 [Candidatus Pacearchaeota archaeon]|nr:hypothetical protein [Candidatus Pacearchaeota archaeon]